MIKTNKGVYPTRAGELVPIHIEILAIQDEFKESRFKFVIGDYIFDRGEKRYVNDRTITLSYAERDALKTAILTQISVEGSESEINKTILPNALMCFLINDFVDVENQKLIYGTIPSDWEICTE